MEAALSEGPCKLPERSGHNHNANDGEQPHHSTGHVQIPRDIDATGFKHFGTSSLASTQPFVNNTSNTHLDGLYFSHGVALEQQGINVNHTGFLIRKQF